MENIELFYTFSDSFPLYKFSNVDKKVNITVYSKSTKHFFFGKKYHLKYCIYCIINDKTFKVSMKT